MQEFDYLEINVAFPKVIVQCDTTLVLFEYPIDLNILTSSGVGNILEQSRESLQCNEETSEQIFFS